MFRAGVVLAFLAGGLFAATPFEQAQHLYQHTEYQGALKILLAQPQRDSRTWALIGQCYFMETDYKKATDAFEKAVAGEPENS